MSNDKSNDDLDRDERRRTPVTTLQLFRQAWEELRRETTDDLTVRNVQVVSRDGETKQLSCLEFWIEMFEQVTEQKLRPDYLFTLVAEQQIWERFTVALEYPTDNESPIYVRGLYYTPRPSNQYLQNLNLRYDQWFIVQDFPPKPKVIKILRRRCGSPSSSDDEIIRRLVQAMDFSSATPSRSVSRCITEKRQKRPGEGRIKFTISPSTVARAISNATANPLPSSIARAIFNVTPKSSPDRIARAILNVTPNSSPDRIARAILNVTPNSSPHKVTHAILNAPSCSTSETVNNDISIPSGSQNEKTPMPEDDSQKHITPISTPISTQKDNTIRTETLPVINAQSSQGLVEGVRRQQQPMRFDHLQGDGRPITPQPWVRFNQVQGDRRPLPSQQWMRFMQQQGDHRHGFQQQWMRYAQQQGARRLAYQQHFKQNSPYYRGRGFRLQRAFRQRPSLLQQLPLTPTPAHLPLTYLNPRFPYPAHRANPHYDSAWNYSNIFSPYQVVPWDGANSPLTTLPQAVPQMYTQMPYVQVPGPYWMPTDSSQLPQTVNSSMLLPNPWTPQSEPIGISSDPKYYPAENFQAAHLSTYQDPVLPQDDQEGTDYPDINTEFAHQASIVQILNIQPSEKVTQEMLRAKDTAARQLETNCRKIESHHVTEETKNPITILQRSTSASKNTEKSGETQTVWRAQTPLSTVIPLSERQSVETNVQSEKNGQTQKTQPLKDSEIFKVPLPVSKPTWRKSAVSNQSQKQTGQKRKAVQYPKIIPGKDSKTTKQDTQKLNEDKENKNPVDEREYLRTPSIFEILESRKKADPKELEKAPTNYMEDVVQRKERRWKSMDKVPGSPRLDLVLDMIRRDNEMLEEEERLQREKEKSQNAASSSEEKKPISSKQTTDEYEKPSQEKSRISQHIPTLIAAQTELDKKRRKEFQIIKNLETIQYTDTTDEFIPIEIEDMKPPIISLPTVLKAELYDQDEDMHFIKKQEEALQSKERVTIVSSSQIVKSATVCQQSRTSEDTATTSRTQDKIKVEIDTDEMALLDNLTTSKERFSPEVWVPDNVVLQLKDKGFVKQRKPKPPFQPTPATIELAMDKKIYKVQKLTKRPSASPVKKQTGNNDQPIKKKKKKSSRECSTAKSEAKEPVKYSARDQATQTSDIEYVENAEVSVETKEESSQANEDVKPKLLSYAAIVRKNTKK